ncbi:MAG: hypothetical protein WAN43_00325 [Rhodomicrobium sp.]
MWVFCNDGFLSIVADRNSQDTLLVRARKEGHIQAVFGDVEVTRTPPPKADYLYRAFIPRKIAAHVVAKRLMNIDYDNFKDSIPADIASLNYHDACTEVWSAMYSFQHGEEPR